MSQRRPRKSYGKSTLSVREKVANSVIDNFPLSENVEVTDNYIPISDTIQNVSRTSPRDLLELKSPIKSPRVQLSSKILSSPIENNIKSPTRESIMTSPRRTLMTSPARESIMTSPARESIMTSPARESITTSPRRTLMTSPRRTLMTSPRRTLMTSPRRTLMTSPARESIMTSPRRTSTMSSLNGPPLRSPRLKSPKLTTPSKGTVIDMTPDVGKFITSSNDTRSLYDKRVFIETLDSPSTPETKGIHKVTRETNMPEKTRLSNNEAKNTIEKEVGKIINNNDYRTSSTKLPRVESKVVNTPRKNEFTPSYGDTFTRNGITYVYDTEEGWRPLSAEEPRREDVTPKKKEKSSIYRDIPNYSVLTPEQQVYLRTKYNIKFDMMRETWPQYEIPTIGDNVPLEHIHIMYNHYVKHVYARENAQTYELYMIVGWIAMQAIAVKLLNLPAQGFYKFRMNRMGKYRMLLIQLGEKYHGEFGEGWPVEIKILVMSIVEIAVFIGLKLLLSLGDEANETTVSFITNLIDRHFGITGISSSVSDTGGLAVRTPEINVRKNNDEPSIVIPKLPEETNDISNITSWIPKIASTLGIDNEQTNTKHSDTTSNNTTERVKARAAGRTKQYSPPPFNY